MSVPLTLLTGFLGSGKTTLLNRLLAAPSMADSAVLINEFGEAAVDHLLVDSIDDDIVVLESGCVCCSVRDDLTGALLSLAERQQDGVIPPLRRIILETTGIADPLPICRQIMNDGELSARYRTGPILTVIDGVYGPATLDRHLEAVRQAVIADHLIVSKVDMIDTRRRHDLQDRLYRLNPAATVSLCDPERDIEEMLKAVSDRAGSEAMLTRLQRCAARDPHAHAGGDTHDHRFDTFLLAWDEAVDWPEFNAWLEGLLTARGAQIYRLKGLVNISGEPVLVQGVQQSFYPPKRLAAWPGERRTQLVLITRDLPRQALMNSVADVLNICCRE